MPVFEADNDDFTLTLYNPNYGSSYSIQANENVIEISQEKIKQLMSQNILRRIF